MNRDLPPGFDDDLPTWPVGGKMATRKASQAVLHALSERLPELVGGSADLAGSNLTDLPGERAMAKGDHAGRTIHFGIREHAMAAAANGMVLHRGIRPFVATFLVFADYLRPSLRLSALMRQPVVYVMTHDSIGLGGDGPTHQPIETLASLRALPDLVVFRPADANETAQAWVEALRRRDGPTLLALTRQDVPHLDVPAGAVARGAYVMAGADEDADVLLIATGSEVAVALGAREKLAEAGVAARVVSMPSRERFEDQDADYRDAVLPPALKARVVVEAAATFGWHRYAGDHGEVVGIDRFGASAPGARVLKEFGFTPRAGRRGRPCACWPV
jgi:transketolase